MRDLPVPTWPFADLSTPRAGKGRIGDAVQGLARSLARRLTSRWLGRGAEEPLATPSALGTSSVPKRWEPY